MSKIELHLENCLQILKEMPDKSIDAILTDPPYGINIIRGGGRGINGWRKYSDSGWDRIRPERTIFEEILRVGKKIIIWGGNYFTDYLPPSSQWLIWDKGQRNFSLADCEMAWSSQNKAARIFTFPRAKMRKEGGLHPTQKPIELMKWCLEFVSKPEDTILDPFMGSGTTGIACIETGRNFIGIEIDSGYFEIAKERLSAALST